ncbi:MULTISPECIES: recombinase family protein [unclassified Corynebacterium]|uniref:recombinase family protein n=1 Tax=unclassified Corynebacterium TaxID=2624378 RepID=UPI001D0DE0CE|nr:MULTISPECIES: recombinase family protein [unclassified Corynebacterium]
MAGTTLQAFTNNSFGTIRTIEAEGTVYFCGRDVATTLTKEGIPSPGYTKGKWYANIIDSILRNEKYKDDTLLQKTYITDFLAKKQIKNHGEIAQSYVTGSREAIIDPDTWDLVQAELASYKEHRGIYPFA